MMWKRCPECDDERPVDESFCAGCGADMAAAERELLRSMQRRIDEIAEMIQSSQLNEAVLALQELTSRKGHPCFAEVRVTAEQMLRDTTARRDRQVEQDAVHLGRAKVLLDEYRYQEALEELHAIPAPMRDETATRMRSRAESACQEISQLKDQLQQNEGVAFGQRMQIIDRLLELSPTDPRIRKWATQIHDYVLEAAHKKLQRQHYREALELVTQLPDSVQSERTQKLLKHVAELEYLESELQLAPTVTAALIEAAKRLLHSSQEHQAAKEALADITRRQRDAGWGSDPLQRQWAPCPQETRLGLPVHACFTPQRLPFATPQLRQSWHQHPGQFFVACGLALQAVNRAAATTNLRPGGRPGVLGKLRTTILDRPMRSGWGLDLSHTGLKAVQVSVGDDGQLLVTQCAHVAHRQDLSGLADTAARTAVLDGTLNSFVERYKVDNGQRIATQWPAVQSLARMFTVPPVTGKKLKELLNLEARHQIPFPLEEVYWDTFLSPTPESHAIKSQRHVLLLAARQHAIEQRLDLLNKHGMEAQVVQIDAVALT